MEIDIERLRQDLINYFGTANGYNPMAVIDLAQVERVSDDKIIRIAKNNNFDLEDYIVNSYGSR